jgi:hypothetical protein
MKKIKLMLLSLSILAVVGGALAFTLKEGTEYCTAPTIKVNNVVTYSTTCSVIGKLKDNGVSTDNIATTTKPAAGCATNTPCFTTNPGLTKE